MNIHSIIEGCLAGNGPAQRKLYEHFLPYVLTIVRRFGVREAEQADLIQDVFVDLFQGLSRFDAQKGNMHQWVRGITVHKTIAHQKKQKRFRQEELMLSNQKELVAQINLQHLDAEYLLALIDQLPIGYRTVFNLYVVEGYSHQEISDILGISAVGSRSQLSRAKNLLRDMLGSQKLITTYGAF